MSMSRSGGSIPTFKEMEQGIKLAGLLQDILSILSDKKAIDKFGKEVLENLKNIEDERKEIVEARKQIADEVKANKEAIVEFRRAESDANTAKQKAEDAMEKLKNDKAEFDQRVKSFESVKAENDAANAKTGRDLLDREKAIAALEVEYHSKMEKANQMKDLYESKLSVLGLKEAS